MSRRPPITSGSHLDLLRGYLLSQGWRVVLLAALVLGTVALQLANPQIIRYFLDTLETGGQFRTLIGAASLFMVITILQQAVRLAATYVGEIVGWTATNGMRSDLARHCLGLDMSFHKAHTAGELIERVDGDINELSTFFSRMVLTLVGNFLLFLGVVILLWIEAWQMGLGMTLVLFASGAVVNYLRKTITPRWEALRSADADLFGYIEERLNGTEDIQTSGASAYILQGLNRLLYQRWQAAKHALRIDAWMVSMPVWIFGAAYAVAHLVGGSLYLNQRITIGTVYLIFFYISTVEGPMWQIMDMIDRLQRATAAINRVTRLFQVEGVINDGEGVTLPAGALAVEFDRVTFQYDDELHTGSLKPATPADKPDPQQGGRAADEQTEVVVHDVSFHLAPATVLGLLGRTGSGKSTLSKLLFRFYDPTAGAIRLGVDGGMVDLRQARRADLRGRIGMVTQTVELFHASVRDNLTLFDDTIAEARILQVIGEVGLTEWLDALPNGLDSELSGDESALSAGEAQLLAFCRVFLAEPGLVILDEASSRLDPATEQRIETALDRLLAERTCIIIAHRLATIQRADEIMILEGGAIREAGKRRDLAEDPNSHFSHLLATGLEEAFS